MIVSCNKEKVQKLYYDNNTDAYIDSKAAVGLHVGKNYVSTLQSIRPICRFLAWQFLCKWTNDVLTKLCR